MDLSLQSPLIRFSPTLKYIKMAKLESLQSGYYVWKYVPSMAAAVIFLVLFFLATIIHFWKIFRKRVRFTLPFAIGGLCKMLTATGLFPVC